MISDRSRKLPDWMITFVMTDVVTCTARELAMSDPSVMERP
jgi:hypothetical protein